MMVQTETHTRFQSSIPVVTEERRVELELLRKHSTRHPEGVFFIYINTNDSRKSSVHKCALNWLYAQLHYFLNFSQLFVSCLPLLSKLD